MGERCGSHPAEPAVGICRRCGKPVCDLCGSDRTHEGYCSTACLEVADAVFTEIPPAGVDPLGDFDFSSPPQPVPHVLDELSDSADLGLRRWSPRSAPVPDAAPVEILLPPGTPPPPPEDDSGEIELPSRLASDETSSLLEMTPVRRGTSSVVPIVVPGTRRLTIQAGCHVHPDTPAIVLCAECGNPICPLCATETPEGLVCGHADAHRGHPIRNALLAATGAAVLIGGIVLAIVVSKTPPTPVAAAPSIAAPAEVLPAPEPVIVPEPELPKAEAPKPKPKPEPEPEPPVEVKETPAPPHLAFIRDPWSKEKTGAWYRTKTTDPAGRESYRDVGLRESGVGYHVLATQTSVGGSEVLSWVRIGEANVFGSVQGTDYVADIVTVPSHPSRCVLKEGPHAGAVFPSDGVLLNLEVDHFRVKDRVFSCSVMEIESRDNARVERIWFSTQMPLGTLKSLSGGTTTLLIDLGDDWSRRPPFPAPPEVAKVEPPPPAPPKAEVLPPPPPPKPVVSPVDQALQSAALLIREAAPIFKEVVDTLDPLVLESAQIQGLLAKIALVEGKLHQAQGLYARLESDGPDRETLKRRIRLLDELIEALEAGMARIRIPRMILEAAVRIKEAVPLYKEVADAEEPERKGLFGKADAAAGKLREARELYVRAKPDHADPALIDRRVRMLDDLIGTLEARLPKR